MTTETLSPVVTEFLDEIFRGYPYSTDTRVTSTQRVTMFSSPTIDLEFHNDRETGHLLEVALYGYHTYRGDGGSLIIIITPEGKLVKMKTDGYWILTSTKVGKMFTKMVREVSAASRLA